MAHRHSAVAAIVTTVLVLAVTACMPAGAQLIISNVGTSHFPFVDADIIVLDPGGFQVRDLRPDHFTIAENGRPVAFAVTTECPPPKTPQGMIALLLCDASGSMGSNSKLELMKQGARAFVSAVVFGNGTTVTVTAFNNYPTRIVGPTEDRFTLLQRINAITSDGSTEFNPAFLDPQDGGIPTLARQPSGIPRVLVFLTDGQPSDVPDVPGIVAAANAANVRIYVITLLSPMSGDLQTIADATGGRAFGNVNSASQIAAIYSDIALREQNTTPCHIRWLSGSACERTGTRHTATIAYLPLKDTTEVSYDAPPWSVTRITIDQSYIWFGAVPPPLSATAKLSVVVTGSPVTILGDSIDAGQPFVVEDWGGPPPPFELRPGDSRTLTLRFTAVDSALHFAELRLKTVPCDVPPTTLVGGVWNDRRAQPLRLVTPRGGEAFDGCDTIRISWTGVLPTAPIRIEYRDREDGPWTLIADSARGLHYQWRPPAPGTMYRIRISAAAAGLVDTITTVAGGGVRPAQNTMQALDARLDHPAGVAVSGNMLYFTEPSRHIVRVVNLRDGSLSTMAGTGIAGYTGDGGQAAGATLNTPTSLAAVGRSLFIVDAGNHCVRRVDMPTGIITTLAGDGTAGFDKEAGAAQTIRLDGPNSIAASSNRLFISDSGNNRIRMVDLATGALTTVWREGPTAALAVAPRPNGTLDTLYFTRTDLGEIWELDGMLNSSLPVLYVRPDAMLVHDNDLYFTDSVHGAIAALDRRTHAQRFLVGGTRPGFFGDGGPAPSAGLDGPLQLTADSARLYVADAGNNRVRMIRNGAFGQSDSSRSTFSATTGHLLINLRGDRVDFGTMGVGSWRDTTLPAILCNDGMMPFDLDSIVITGPNAADFQIASSTQIQDFPPATCRAMEFRFTPSGLGLRTAIAIAYGRCAGRDTLQLRGTGGAPCQATALDIADMHGVAIDAARDSAFTTLLCNGGSGVLRGHAGIVPSDGAFSIVGGARDFVLAPGECLALTIRFAPRTRGRMSAALEYGLPTACGRTQTTLLGTGLAPQRLEAAPRMRFADAPCARWPRDTTLDVTNTGDAPLVVTDLQLRDNDEGYAIIAPLPTAATPLVIAPDESAAVTIRLNPATTGAKKVTLRIVSNDPAGAYDVALEARRDSLALDPGATSLIADGTLPAGTFPLDTFIVLRNTGTAPVTILGAALAGGDSTRFAITGPPLPHVIPAGGADTLRLRIAGPTSGAPFVTALRLAAVGLCDSMADIAIVETGGAPVMLVARPEFRDLRCDADATRDTAITVTNSGPGVLTISALTIIGADRNAFTVAAATPMAIPPAASATIPLRFAPLAPGTYHAQLVIASDAAGGDMIVPLDARRLLLALSADPPSIELGAMLIGTATARSALLVNKGSATLALTASAASPDADVRPASLVTLAPGDSMTVTITVTPHAAGTLNDTLVVSDLDCGVLLRIPIHGTAGAISTVVALPVDSALPGAVVALPVRITIDNHAAFVAAGAGTYRATIDYDGLLLAVDSASDATLREQTFDEHTGAARIVLDGQYAGGALLTVLHAHVPSSALGTTPLRFADFAWATPLVRGDTINGLFTVMPGCMPGATLSARILALKVAPHPAHGEATATFELGEVETVRLVVRDLLGRTVVEVDAGRLEAGPHAVGIPLAATAAGFYTLSVETVFGTVNVRLVVVR